MIFSSSFIFSNIQLYKYHHTDNSKGTPMHYIAYMNCGNCHIESEKSIVEIKEGDVFYIPQGCRYHSYWHGKDIINFNSYGFIYFPNFEKKVFTLRVIDSNNEILEYISKLSLNCQPNAETIGLFHTLLGLLIPKMKFQAMSKDMQLITAVEKYFFELPNAKISDWIIVNKVDK